MGHKCVISLSKSVKNKQINLRKQILIGLKLDLNPEPLGLTVITETLDSFLKKGKTTYFRR